MKKKILAEKSDKGIIKTAISNSENEKMEILGFVLNGLNQQDACNEPPEYRAYSDSTYLKQPD